VSLRHDQMVIVEKYETFLNYFYPVVQNIPRVHGTAKDMLTRDLLGQVNLFLIAGKSGQISRLYEADAGLANLRFWLRFMSNPSRKIITIKQHQIGEVMLSEVGKILGSWIERKQNPSKE